MTARDALADGLETIRGERRARWMTTAVGVGVGLVLAALDPLGIVVGAALVATPARDPYRGLGAALGFGGLVLVAFLVQLSLAGTLGPAIATGAPYWLAIGIALGGSLLGGLVRGLG